jgi:Kef-type K+ transport system membrane component KefB
LRIVPLEEHVLLIFWVQLVVLVVTARLLGAAARRYGQPAVIGELAAGVVLGPSVFGALFPSGARWLFPGDPVQGGLLQVVGWLGIVLLLVLTGFETDLTLIRQLGRAAATVAAASILLPFVLGLAAGLVVPGSFVAVHSNRTVFALFVATALSISSLPVIAKVLSELQLTRRNFGQLTLAAGMANDVVGWLLLGAIAGLARHGSVQLGPLAMTIAGMGIFLVAALTIGQRGVDRLLRTVRARSTGVSGAFTVTVVVAFAAGALTQALGVEAVLGAFVAGIVLGRSKFQDSRVVAHLETATLTVLAPLFFASAGLRVDLTLLTRPDVLGWALVMIAVASVGKLGGAYIGGRLARLPRREGLALGLGLNARGALEIVVATVGVSLGVLNPRMYTVVVMIAITTSMAAPPLLRRLARAWAGTPEEQARLEREESLRENLLIRPQRTLIPVRRGDGSKLAAKLVDLAWPAGAESAVVSLDPEGVGRAAGVAEVFRNRPVEREYLDVSDPVDELVRHMGLGFGALALGAADDRADGLLLTPLAEALLARTTLPAVIVWDGRQSRLQTVTGFNRVLLPVVATVPNRAAQEVAFSLAGECGADVVVAHVVGTDSQPNGAAAPASPSARRRLATRTRSRTTMAEGIVAEAMDLARRFGVRPRRIIRQADSRADAIVGLAAEIRADLVVLSAELQAVAGEPFLGSLVEEVVAEAAGRFTVAVVAVPPRWPAETE